LENVIAVIPRLRAQQANGEARPKGAQREQGKGAFHSPSLVTPFCPDLPPPALLSSCPLALLPSCLRALSLSSSPRKRGSISIFLRGDQEQLEWPAFRLLKSASRFRGNDEGGNLSKSSAINRPTSIRITHKPFRIRHLKGFADGFECIRNDFLTPRG
jgi:hypothetical protein